MTHAHFADFSRSLAIEPVPFHADPILAAIDRHAEAWAVFQVAPEGEASEIADAETFASLDALLGTGCHTRQGAFCLLRHLRWWLGEEAVNADAYGEAWAVAQAREGDLTLLLGCEIWRPALHAAEPDTLPAPHAPLLAYASRAASSAGEIAAALVLTLGGAVLTGLATLI